MKKEPSPLSTGEPMPYLIPDAEFNVKLKIHAKNVEHTQAFLEKGVQEFILPNYTLPQGYRLVKGLRNNQYRLLTQATQPETVYLVELIFRQDIVFSKTTCTQVKVWRTVSEQHDTATRHLPRSFFKYLLDIYNIIVSDEEQTNAGKRFWETMIDWAFQTGFHVYVSDGGEEDRPLTAVKNTDDLYEQREHFCWGRDRDVHTHRLIVISKEQLSQ